MATTPEVQRLIDFAEDLAIDPNNPLEASEKVKDRAAKMLAQAAENLRWSLA